MRECVLRAYREGFELIGEVAVELPDEPSLSFFERLGRTELLDPTMTFACIESGDAILALFVPEKLLPRQVVAISQRRASGRWFTGTVALGPEGGHRALVGPEVFLRQFDVGGPDAWMALVFLRFGASVEVEELCSGPRSVGSWRMDGQRYLYVRNGWRWRLWGAGNTPAERIGSILAGGLDPEQLTWQLGAVPLTRS